MADRRGVGCSACKVSLCWYRPGRTLSPGTPNCSATSRGCLRPGHNWRSLHNRSAVRRSAIRVAARSSVSATGSVRNTSGGPCLTLPLQCIPSLAALPQRPHRLPFAGTPPHLSSAKAAGPQPVAATSNSASSIRQCDRFDVLKFAFLFSPIMSEHFAWSDWCFFIS